LLGVAKVRKNTRRDRLADGDWIFSPDVVEDACCSSKSSYFIEAICKPKDLTDDFGWQS
jgi:hypothetical protein